MTGLLEPNDLQENESPNWLGGLLGAIGAGMIGYRNPEAGMQAAMQMAHLRQQAKQNKRSDLLEEWKLRQLMDQQKLAQSVDWNDPKGVMQYLANAGKPASAASVFNTQQVSGRFGKSFKLPMQDGTVMEVAMDANGNLQPLGPSLAAVKDGGQLTFQNGRWGTTPVPGQTEVLYRNKAAETAGSEGAKTSMQYGPDGQPIVVPNKSLMQNAPSSGAPTGYLPRIGPAGPANQNADDIAMQWAGDLMPGLMKTESNGRSDAVSPTGARGIAQMMPSTARSEFGISDNQWNAMNDAQQALYSQMYLAKNFRDNNLDPNRALMAYNAGQAGMEAGNGSPAYAANVIAQSDRLRGDTNPFPTVPTGRFMTEADKAAQKSIAEASGEPSKRLYDELIKNYETLSNAPATLANIERAKTLIPQASNFVGSMGESKLSAAKFLNNNLGLNVDIEGVKSAEELRSGLFLQILDNLKKMDAQPSQQQQQIMMNALGSLGTDPGALPRVLDIYGNLIRDKVKLHNSRVDEAAKNGARFPFSPVINVDGAGVQPAGGKIKFLGFE